MLIRSSPLLRPYLSTREQSSLHRPAVLLQRSHPSGNANLWPDTELRAELVQHQAVGVENEGPAQIWRVWRRL